MRITRRQLTQIIREELIREAAPTMGTTVFDDPLPTGGTAGVSAVSTTVPDTTSPPGETGAEQAKIPSTPKRRRIPNDTVKEIQRLLGVPDDGVWGKETQAAWRDFVMSNYTQEGPGAPDAATVVNAWPTAAAFFGLDQGPAGALQFIQSTKVSKSEPIPAGAVVYGPKSPLKGVVDNIGVIAARIPSDLHINDSPTYWQLAFRKDKSDPWSDWENWSTTAGGDASLIDHADALYDYLAAGGQISIVGPGTTEGMYAYTIYDAATLKNFLTPGPGPQHESVSRWSRLAGLLVD